MNKKLIFASTNLLLTIACLFAPFFHINYSIYSLTEFISTYGFSWCSFLLILPYILSFLSTLIFLIFKQNYVKMLCFSAFISSAVLLVFSRGIVASYYQIHNISYSSAPIMLSLYNVIVSLLLSRSIFDSNKFAIRDTVEIAIFVSFAIVLDFAVFKIKLFANGGSISLVMLPLFIVCLRKGFFKGFIATGIIFGLLSCLLDGYGIVYYPFDYLLGFGSIAIIGLFRKLIFTEKKWKPYFWIFVAVSLVFVSRTLAATVSGIVFYKLSFYSSLVYQLAYVGPSCLISFVGILLLYRPLKTVNKRFAS